MRVWTDGACERSGARGGIGALIVTDDGSETEIRRGYTDTTNQRMEMLAACVALESIAPGTEVRLTTDSRYVERGITDWIYGWKRYDWINSKGEPVANRDLWERLDAARERLDVTWRHVRGHTGDPGNERADRLAVWGRKEDPAPLPDERCSRKEPKTMSNPMQIAVIEHEIDGGQPRRYADSVWQGTIKVVKGTRTFTEQDARELVAILTGRASAKKVEKTLAGYATFTPVDATPDMFGGPIRAARWNFTITEPYTD